MIVISPRLKSAGMKVGTPLSHASYLATIEDLYGLPRLGAAAGAPTLMEFFVKQGIPLRSAHEAVGKLIRQCEDGKSRLVDLPVEAFDAIKPGISSEVKKVLGVANALAAFQSVGSTAPAEVAKQLEAWRKRLGQKGPES